MESGIVNAVGATPLVRLTHLVPDAPFQLYAKLEFMNPTGSGKDRSAMRMVREGLEAGDLNGNSIVVEESQGETGLALAQACRYHQLRFMCVTDADVPEHVVKQICAYGATVVQAEPLDGEATGAARRRVALEILDQIDNAARLSKEENPFNPVAHQTTMRELADALDGQVDYVIAGARTTGTVRGLAEYARAAGIFSTVVAVDLEGSAIFGGTGCDAKLRGLGASEPPLLLLPQLVDRVVQVSDRECVLGCRTLTRLEAILGGASCGGVVAALQKLAPEIEAGANVILMLTDRGDRFLDTVYSDTWVEENLGPGIVDAQR